MKINKFGENALPSQVVSVAFTMVFIWYLVSMIDGSDLYNSIPEVLIFIVILLVLNILHFNVASIYVSKNGFTIVKAFRKDVVKKLSSFDRITHGLLGNIFIIHFEDGSSYFFYYYKGLFKRMREILSVDDKDVELTNTVRMLIEEHMMKANVG